MTFDSLLSGFIGAVIGGLLAGAFTVYAVYKANDLSRTGQRDLDDQSLKGLLQALLDELDVLFERYQATMGAKLEAHPDGQPLLLYYPVVNEFFTVYNANASRIGQIKDDELRRTIVRTYVLAKGLVDSFRMNNDMVAKYEYWETMAGDGDVAAYKNRAASYIQALSQYATMLRVSHFEVKASFETLKRLYKLQART